jgi:hypothetical protein
MLDCRGGDALRDDGHKEFVEAGHQGNGSEVAGISGGVLFVDQDGSGSFPLSWYIAGFKTVAVKLSQGLTFGIKETKVSVFETVFARCGIREGAQLLGEFFWSWHIKECVI